MSAANETGHTKSALGAKSSPRPRRRFSVRKKVSFTFVAVCGFLLLLEFSLAVFGVKPRWNGNDPFVGFAPDIPLFVRWTDLNGEVVLETARNKLPLFNRQVFPLRKPTDSFRVFCIGGSTTRGFPFDDSTSFSGWLREFLPVVEPSRRWEVINAGASSYASYRVVRVMEELCEYSPDLFVVYAGHNEFMERRSYGTLIDAPDCVLAAGALATRTRMYAALEMVLRAASGNGKRDAKHEKLLGPDVQALATLHHAIGPNDYSRDDRLRRQILRHYRFNLERMIAIARRASAEIVLVVPACNLLHWSPYKSEHREGLSKIQQSACQALLKKAEQAQANGEFPDALDALDEMLKIDDRYALAYYRRGQILYAIGQYSDARTALARARDEDVCSLRALTEIEEIVRRTAAKYRVPVLDFARVVQKESPHGIAGKECFLDDVHPNVAMHRLLALELLEKLSQIGIAPPKSTWDRATMREVTEAIQDGIDRDDRSRALFDVSSIHAWAGHWKESLRLAHQAFDLSPQLRDATDSLASIHWRFGEHLLKQGKPVTAIEQFREVLRLIPNLVVAQEQIRIAEQVIDDR